MNQHTDDTGDIDPVRSGEADKRAWGVANFRRLWWAGSVSVFGSEIGELALPLLAIITLSASPSEVGLLRTAQFLPFLVATLPLGIVVDRARRKPLMIGADLGRFVLISMIPVTIWWGLPQIELLYVLVFAAGCLTVLYTLADFAYLPTLLPRHQIVDANGKLSASQSANSIAGKGVGGVIVDLLTVPVAVLFDGLTYLASALNLARISKVEAAPIPKGEATAVRDAWEGLRYAVSHRIVRPLLGEATTFNFFSEILVLGLLLHTAQVLGLSPTMIGLIFVAGGLGSFLGAWFGARLTHRFGYGRVLLTTLILGNTAPAAVVFIGDDAGSAMAILLAAFWVMGVGIGVANVHAISLRQTAIPDSLLGRVNAGYRLVSWGAIPLGAFIGGLLAAALGAFKAMAIGALGIPLATLWVAFSPIPKLTAIDEAAHYSDIDR